MRRTAASTSALRARRRGRRSSPCAASMSARAAACERCSSVTDRRDREGSAARPDRPHDSGIPAGFSSGRKDRGGDDTARGSVRRSRGPRRANEFAATTTRSPPARTALLPSCMTAGHSSATRQGTLPARLCERKGSIGVVRLQDLFTAWPVCGRRGSMPYTRDSLPPGQTDWARLEREAGDSAISRPDVDNPEWTAAAFAEAEYVDADRTSGCGTNAPRARSEQERPPPGAGGRS